MRDTSIILAARRRRDAYLNSLSDSDFKKAVAILIEPAFSLSRAWKELPPWGPGKFAGCRLSVQSVFTLRQRLRLMTRPTIDPHESTQRRVRGYWPPPKKVQCNLSPVRRVISVA